MGRFAFNHSLNISKLCFVMQFVKLLMIMKPLDNKEKKQHVREKEREAAS